MEKTHPVLDFWSPVWQWGWCWGLGLHQVLLLYPRFSSGLIHDDVIKHFSTSGNPSHQLNFAKFWGLSPRQPHTRAPGLKEGALNGGGSWCGEVAILPTNDYSLKSLRALIIPSTNNLPASTTSLPTWWDRHHPFFTSLHFEIHLRWIVFQHSDIKVERKGECAGEWTLVLYLSRKCWAPELYCLLCLIMPKQIITFC